MPCHAATLSLGDTTTVLSLFVCLAGLAMAASVWLSGSLPGGGALNPFHKLYALFGSAAKSIFSRKSTLIIKTLFYDVFLQRRLYRRYKTRWFIHGLIFFPFVFRFVWGVVGLFASIWAPQWPMTLSLLDKNHPMTALLFDLTGLLIFLGVVFALTRRGVSQPDQLPGLPKPDRLALILIGGIVVIGFIMEGVRIAMTGEPGNSGYAVLGYGVSMLFSGMTELTDVYGAIWYIHAVLTGMFVAYFPFSRLMHIIMAPVVLLMNAVADHENRERRSHDG